MLCCEVLQLQQWRHHLQKQHRGVADAAWGSIPCSNSAEVLPVVRAAPLAAAVLRCCLLHWLQQCRGVAFCPGDTSCSSSAKISPVSWATSLAAAVPRCCLLQGRHHLLQQCRGVAYCWGGTSCCSSAVVLPCCPGYPPCSNIDEVLPATRSTFLTLALTMEKTPGPIVIGI